MIQNSQDQLTRQSNQAKATRPPKELIDKLIDRENTLIMRQSPKWLQVFSIFLLLIGGGIFITAYLVRIDEVVTTQGQLTASGKGKQDIKSPVGGKVLEVAVKEGDFVDAGTLLIQFDTTLAQENLERTTDLIRLESESLKKELTALNIQKSNLQNRLSTSRMISEEYKSLLKTGSVSRLQYLDARDRTLGLTNELALFEERIEMIKITSKKKTRDLNYELKTAEQKIKYQNINSGISGIVFDLKASPDGVLASGESILTIVPKDGLSAKAFIPNKDIGFVQVGQKAKVRVDAFPSSRYGELNGKVELIGADVLPPDQNYPYYRFPINVSLESNKLEANNVSIPLRSGMAVTINLIIRNKRVISLVSDFFAGQMDSIKSLRN
jgi:hemolysin D